MLRYIKREGSKKERKKERNFVQGQDEKKQNTLIYEKMDGWINGWMDGSMDR